MIDSHHEAENEMTQPSHSHSTPGENRFRLLDYVGFLVDRKELFLVVFVGSLLLCYGVIYFFVDEQFDASATIVPREDSDISGVAGLLRGAKGLPLGLGSSSISTETDLYKTVLMSRTLLEQMVRDFDLVTSYAIDSSRPGYMEAAVEGLRRNIGTRETEEGAFRITVRAESAEKASDMTNAIVDRMNDMIVDLNVRSSRENRIFLEQRVAEVREQLTRSEDSLRSYQERSGMLDAKAQLEGILVAHVQLETELTALEVQRGIMRGGFDDASPQVRSIEGQIRAYKDQLTQMRTKGNAEGPMIALKKLPEAAVEYLRRYREVEINQLVLEFVIPMYEQAKVQEKKDYPILQVIDNAVPPSKKSYPPRTLLSFVGSMTISVFLYVLLVLRNAYSRTTDDRVRGIAQSLKKWNWGSGR